jgi:hypothetical protein
VISVNCGDYVFFTGEILVELRKGKRDIFARAFRAKFVY